MAFISRFRAWLGRFSTSWFALSDLLFACLLLLNVVYVLSLDFFFTGDGPAHLYNANIIEQLLQGEASISAFFELRRELIPNLGGHALLVLFKMFFSAAAAEKLLFALYFALFPLSAYYLLGAFGKKQQAFVFLLFPFAHNFCLYIGFQSFCLGLTLGIFCVGYFLRGNKRKHARWYLWLALLLFVTAFFHLFALVMSAFAMVAIVVLQAIRYKRMDWTHVAFSLLSAAPALLFCGAFLWQHGGDFTLNPRGFSEMLPGVVHNSSLITLSVQEARFIDPFSILLLCAFVWVVFWRLRNKRGVRVGDFALMLALCAVAGYFLLPDKMASGGFVSMRMLLYASLFFSVWCSVFLKQSAVTALFMLLAVLVNLRLLAYHFSEAKVMSADAALVYEAAQYIPEGSTLVPMNYAEHWLHYNIGLYMGAERNIIVLDNYEASTEHFPVKWREEAFPGDKLGNFGFSKRPYLKVYPFEEQGNYTLDAVMRWQHREEMDDSATVVTNQVLDSLFTPVYISEKTELKLYLRK
jgi:hypothetical protein